jgi:Fe2+ transport system protein FeoA
MAADGLVPGVALEIEPGQKTEGIVSVIVGGDPLAVKDHLAQRIYVVPDEA